MAKEPIPDKAYCPPYLSYFLSAGKTQVYQCLSYPLCRVYWENDKPTPWTTESAWYDTGTDKGWVRDGANYPSFLVRWVCPNTGTMGEPTYITLRHKPIWSESLFELINIIEEQRQECLKNPTRPQVDLNQKYVDRMKMLAVAS